MSHKGIRSEQHMTLKKPHEQLDEGNTVGIIDGIDPGPSTVTYHDVGAKFRNHARTDGLHPGDEETTIFVASDAGELSLQYGPPFDAAMSTNLSREQLRTALQALRDAGKHFGTGEITVHFDDSGPLVFESTVTVATTPTLFSWDRPTAEHAPTGPRGPSIRGATDDE